MLPLSILIPTFNRFATLKKVLASLEQQTLPMQDFEIIVIDDGSTDWHYQHFHHLPKQFSKLQLIVHTQKRKGAAQARNRAIEQARGEHLLFLGDDMMAHPSLLKQHLNSHITYPNDSVLGFIDWDSEIPLNPVMQFIAPYGPQFDFNLQDPLDCSFWRFYTSNLSIPKRLLEQERFRTAYPGCCYEDIDLGYRLAQKGMKIIYNPLAITYHHHSHTEASFIKRQRQAGKNLHLLLQFHPEIKYLFPHPELRQKWLSYRWKRFIAKLKGNQRLYYHYTFELAWMKGYFKQLMLHCFLR